MYSPFAFFLHRHADIMHAHHIVFVYGTLRQGGTYHHLMQPARFLGHAVTRERYALYLASYPCVVRRQRVSGIRGEVYAVPPPTLDRLDELEGHPREYCRDQVAVRLDDGGETLAWLYFYPAPVGTLEPSGDYANYLTPL